MSYCVYGLLVNDQRDAQFFLCLYLYFQLSTCFEHIVLIIRRDKLCQYKNHYMMHGQQYIKLVFMQLLEFLATLQNYKSFNWDFLLSLTQTYCTD